MMTINGTGLRHLGIVKTPEKDSYFITVWVTCFYFPILPLRREKVQFLDIPNQSIKERLLQGRVIRQYKILSREKLSPVNILKTYLYGWILLPTLFLGPILFMVGLNEIIKNKLPEIRMISSIITVTGLILWLGIATWKISNWDEGRGYK